MPELIPIVVCPVLAKTSPLVETDRTDMEIGVRGGPMSVSGYQ